MDSGIKARAREKSRSPPHSGEAAQYETAHPFPYGPRRHPGPAGGARAANMAAAEQKGCGGGAARGRPPAEAGAALPHGAALRPRRPSPTAPGAARFQAEAPPGPGRLFVLRQRRENGEQPAPPARLPPARPSNSASEPVHPPTRSGEKKLNGKKKKAVTAKKPTHKPHICLRAPFSNPRRTNSSPPHPSTAHPQEQPEPSRLLANGRPEPQQRRATNRRRPPRPPALRRSGSGLKTVLLGFYTPPGDVRPAPPPLRSAPAARAARAASGSGRHFVHKKARSRRENGGHSACRHFKRRLQRYPLSSRPRPLSRHTRIAHLP